jgi:hypothetical protein
MNRNRLVGVCAAVVALALVLWLAFGRSGDEPTPRTPRPTPKDPLAAKLVEILTPPAPRASDWKNAKVSKHTLGDTGITYWVLTNMRPIMDADTNTTAFHVRATNRRADDGQIVTTVWSNKNGNTLEIVWASGAVNRKDRRTDAGPMFDETHSDQHDARSPGLGFTGSPKLVWRVWEDDKEVDAAVRFDHLPYLAVVGFISNNYPVAAMPLIPNDGRSAPSLLLLDVPHGKLLGKVELAAEAKSGRPNFILDVQNDVLLSAQFGLDWLVAIDLRAYVSKKDDPR